MRYFYKILPFFVLLTINLYAQNQVFTKKIILKVDETLTTNLSQNLSPYLQDKYRELGFLSVRKKFPQIRATSFYAQQTARIYEVELNDTQNISQLLHYLNKQNEIVYAEPVYQANTQNEEDKYYPLDKHWKNQEWYFNRLKLYESWNITKGNTDVVIGIIDTGFELDHIDLTNQWVVNQAEKNGLPNVDDDNNGKIDDVIGWDFGDNDNDVHGDEFTANSAHGTQVSGVASAQTDNDEGIAGVGFYSRLMPLKVYDNQSNIQEDAIYEAMVYGAENGCSVLNISLTSTTTEPMQWQQDVINYVTLEKGVLIVAAAGNAPNEEMTYYPASYQNILSVSGSDRTDEKIDGYPYNTEIDLLAPALDIAVTEGKTDYLMDFRGTSFASPLVAGAGALVKAKYPNLTGLQIAELLRVTGDSIYHIGTNQNYPEKLGYGRLNIFRALTELDSTHAVRLTSHNYHTNFGKYAFREDTVNLELDFINFLQPIDSLSITLTTNSPYVRFLNDSVTYLEDIQSLGLIESEQFKFYLLPETPPETEIKFRIQFDAPEYYDYQYFKIKTSPEYLINQGDIELKVTATANGRIGYADDDYQKGNGISYDSKEVLKEAGLMVGLSPYKFSSSVRKSPEIIAQDFDIQRNVRYTEKNEFQMSSEALFTDNLQNRANKVGVNIRQTVNTKNYGLHRKYTVIEYDIENLTTQPMRNLQVGIYADWEVGEGKNRANWDEEGLFGYVYEENGQYFGIKAFGDSHEYTAINKTTPNGINIQDNFSNFEKYTTMSRGIYRQNAGYDSEHGSDVAHSVGTKIGVLSSKQSKSVFFVIAGADNLQELQNIFKVATSVLDETTSQSPLPEANTVICNRSEMYITPTNGTNFGFFEAENLHEPIYIGDSLPVSVADTAKLYYIMNLDSVRESELLPYKFKTYLPEIQFDATDLINLRDSSIIHVFDHSPNVVNRIWDFGDGSELIYDEPYPTHKYKQLGTYELSLIITDSTGCTNKSIQKLEVISLGVGPMPNVPDLIEVCTTDTVHFAPDNGTNFLFYTPEAFRYRQPIHEGSELFVTASSFDRIYIVNADSVFKSKTKIVQIDWGEMQPDFDYYSKSDTLWNAFITFEDKTVSNSPIVQRVWDFGDSTIVQNDSVNYVSHIYTNLGIYDVKLYITNSRGCIDSVMYQVTAGSKSPIPIISDTIYTCFGDKILLKPQGGTAFNFYADSLNSLLKTGTELTTNPTENQTIYITNIDSTLESYPKKVVLLYYDSDFDFDFPKPLQRTDYKIVEFQNLSKNILKSEWNFGDGKTSSEHNPTHHYNRQGNFKVTLQVTDSTGCTKRMEKEIRVFSESPIPEIDTLIQVCQNASVELQPTNGTTFNFYRSENLNVPIYTGNSLFFEQLSNSQTYYITNIDSVLESESRKVTLSLSQLNSNFSMSATTLDLTYIDSIRIRADDANAVNWSWDFGNGQTAEGRTVFPKYETGGVYPITLTVTDNWNCQLSQTKTISVVPKLIPQSLDALVQIMPNPSKNKIWGLKLHFKEPKEVDTQLFDILGQELHEFNMKYYTKTRLIRFDMQTYPKGIYFLKVQSEGKTVIRKIILQ